MEGKQIVQLVDYFLGENMALPSPAVLLLGTSAEKGKLHSAPGPPWRGKRPWDGRTAFPGQSEAFRNSAARPAPGCLSPHLDGNRRTLLLVVIVWGFFFFFLSTTLTGTSGSEGISVQRPCQAAPTCRSLVFSALLPARGQPSSAPSAVLSSRVSENLCGKQMLPTQ